MTIFLGKILGFYYKNQNKHCNLTEKINFWNLTILLVKNLWLIFETLRFNGKNQLLEFDNFPVKILWVIFVNIAI